MNQNEQSGKNNFEKFHALQQRSLYPLVPKTGLYVCTQGQCFNAASTSIVRGTYSKKA